MSKLLVVVDYQKDFVDGALGYPGAEALEGPLCDKVKAALADGWKVIFTRDTHAPDYLDTREGRFLPVPHCIEGSEGWHLYGRLAEFETAGSESIAFVDKPTFGSMEPGANCFSSMYLRASAGVRSSRPFWSGLPKLMATFSTAVRMTSISASSSSASLAEAKSLSMTAGVP